MAETKTNANVNTGVKVGSFITSLEKQKVGGYPLWSVILVAVSAVAYYFYDKVSSKKYK